MNTAEAATAKAAARNMKLISYGFMLLMFVLIGCLHMATPLLVALLGMFALHTMSVNPRLPKWSIVTLFLLIATGVLFGFVHFIREAFASIPAIADKTIPPIFDWIKAHDIDLPFKDYDSLMDFLQASANMETIKGLGALAKFASMEVVFVFAGIIVAVSLFFNPQTELGRPADALPDNLYALFCDTLSTRFRLLYQSFATVMGAQMTISTINTALTSIFVLSVNLPHPVFVIGATFLCGLLPVIGNLISNTFIVAVAFTVSPTMAILSLAFLVTIHKLEYFLNSKIIGSRIRNPVWLMLLSLIIGEKLLGIAGMILAPVILHYIKSEISAIKLIAAEPAAADHTKPAEHGPL